MTIMNSNMITNKKYNSEKYNSPFYIIFFVMEIIEAVLVTFAKTILITIVGTFVDAVSAVFIISPHIITE